VRSARVSSLVLISYLVLAAGLTIAYFALPRLHMLLWGGLGLSSVVAIIVGVRRNRPERPLAWHLLASALTAFAAGDFTYNFLTLVLREDNPFPSLADAFYLAVCPLAAAALAVFIRSRTPSANTSSMVDALITTAGLGLLSWTYLIEPLVRNGELTWQQRLTSATYPLWDVLLLIQLNGTWAVGGPVDAGWVLFYVLLGAPPAGHRTRENPARRRRCTRRRQ